MRKIVLGLVAFMLIEASGCSEKSPLDQINGTWVFDYKTTWEFRNPGRIYTEDDAHVQAALGGLLVAINAKEQTYLSKSPTNMIKDTVRRFRVASEKKNKVLLIIDGGTESFEIIHDGTLLICPPLGDVQQCLAFKKKSSDPKDIGRVDLSHEHLPPKTTQSVKAQHLSLKNVSLGSFLVNLADSQGNRYIKVSFDVEVKTEAAVNVINHENEKIRKSITDMLSKKTYSDLASVESKLALKNEAKAAINNTLGQNVAERIFIVELIVQ